MKKQRTSGTTGRRKNAVKPAMRELRKRAEDKLARKTSGPSNKRVRGLQRVPASPSDTKRLVHELQVHQTELEMQNEELCRAQLEAEEASRDYRELYETVPVACYTLDGRGTILDVNPAGAVLLRSSSRHVVGRRFPIFLCESDRMLFMKCLRKALKEFSRETVSLRLYDSSTVSVVVVGTEGTLNKQRKPLARLAVMDVTGFIRVQGALQQSNEAFEATIDERTQRLTEGITEQRRLLVEQQQVEQRLRASEERFAALVRASSDVVYRMSPDWTEMHHLVGRDFILDTDEPSRTWLDRYIHSDDQEHVMAVIDEAIRTKSVFELEHRVRRVDGTLGWTFSRAVPILDTAGEIVEWFGMVSDVTEHKQAQEDLRIAQELLQDSGKIGHAGGWEFDIDTRKLNWTDEVYRIHEVSPEFEPTMDKTFAFYVPESRPTIERVMSRAIEAGEPFNVELELVTAKGNRRWVHAIGKRAQRGRRVRGFFQDITARKRAEESLWKSESRFRSFFENAGVGAAQIGTAGRFIHVNDRLCSITGYSQEELLDKMGPLDLDHPDDVEEDKKRITDFFRGTQPYLLYENRYVRKDGHVIWVRVTATPIRDDQGRIQNTAALIEDITKRKQAEEALRLRESEIRTLVENSQDFIVRLDRQGRQIYANPATARLYGLPLQDFLGKNLREMGFPEDVWRPAEDACKQVVATRQEVTLEQRHPFGGTLRYFEARHVPEFAHDGSVATVLVVTRDITERKHAEEERQKFVSLADNSQEFIGMADKEFCPFYVNAAGLRLVGLPNLEAACKVKVQDFFFPEDQPFITNEFFPRVERDGQGEVEIRFRHFQTGEPLWMLYNVFKIRDSRGHVMGWATVSRDISARKQGEEQLKASEELLRAVMNSLTSHIAVLDAQGAIVSVNEAWLRFAKANNSQVSQTAWIGVNYFDVCRKSASQDAMAGEVLQGLEDVLAGVRPLFQVEYSCHSRVEQRWFHLRVTPLLGPTGGLVVSHENITDRKRAQDFVKSANRALEQRVHERTAALAEANERWGWVVQATHDGVWDWDFIHDTVYFSPRWKDLHGFQDGDLLESFEEWSSRIHPEDRQRVMKKLEAYLAGREPAFWEEYRIRRKNGQFIWVLDRGIAIWDEQGRAVRMVGAETDITWRKEAEETLRRREQEFRTLADNVPALFSYIDRERRYRFVNKQYEELFGRSDEEINGMTVSDLLGADGYADVESYINQVLEGEAVSFEYGLTMPGDGVKHLSVQYVPDRDENGQVVGFFALLADITALKSSESALRDREADLRALSAQLLRVQEEERRRLARDLHDDVTQRLAAFTMELHRMKHDVVEAGCDPSVGSKVQGFAESLEQLTTDVQQLAHQLHPSILEHAGLEVAMREVVDDFVSRNGLAVEILVREIPPYIPLDQATCLYRILQESLQNVRKHAEASNVLVRLLGTNQGIGLCVHDDGHGFGSTPANSNRKGLGLTSMAERVRALGGAFRIRTKQGDGTEIHAWVPLEEVKNEAEDVKRKT